MFLIKCVGCKKKSTRENWVHQGSVRTEGPAAVQACSWDATESSEDLRSRRKKETNKNQRWKQSSKWTDQHRLSEKVTIRKRRLTKALIHQEEHKQRFRNYTARQFFSLGTNGRFWFLFDYTLSLCIHVHTLTLLCLCKCMCVCVSLCVQRPESNTQESSFLALSIWIVGMGSLTEWIWLDWLVSKSQGYGGAWNLNSGPLLTRSSPNLNCTS